MKGEMREKEFSLTIEEEYSKIKGMVINAIGNITEAEDIMQEINLSFWNHLKNHRGEAKPSTVLFVIAKRRIADYLRGKYKQSKVFQYLKTEYKKTDAEAIEYFGKKQEFKINLLLHPIFSGILSEDHKELLLAMRKSLRRVRNERQ
jgi:DNA-directed RNA polymerase specialized sigma24 family protein